ncbi:Rv3654c family TadE-like protein [Protaetiibacter larvae]|uniref:Helicase n=1 Tax=Protaetiibacter larvae TaxID=2592654 RepID=A0A5C1Y746_9MICO|nr:Rv3654c family TadE-like protein [Protaetiibacter larvae]QEO08697.1 helicase [Protaetiibacter larvae]
MSARGALRDDRGAGGVLALAVVGATLALVLALLAAAGALAVRSRAAAAADAAALAAADVLLGAIPGSPCALAAQLAAAHQVALAACEVDGMEVIVAVRTQAFGVPIEQRARAGPPP